ncbi:MAG: hypothetical protein V3S00_00040 [Dehalococcoidia bacterium]
MASRTLEEILEECLSAYRDGRRGLEESLSLYPGMAEELESLLRITLEIDAGVRYWAPPEQLQEQVRQRFLAAAAKRRRERVTSERPSGWRWGFSLSRSFAAGTAAATLAVVALTLGAIALLGDSDDGSNGVLVEILPSSTSAATPTPTAGAGDVGPAVTETPRGGVVIGLASQVEQARADLTVLEAVVESGEPIQSEEIGALAETTREIAAQLDEALDEGDKEALVAVISDEFALLSSLDESDLSEGDLEDVKAVLALTEEIANKLGIPLIMPTPVPELTPTPEPTPSPAPEATPTPTPAPTEAPDPTPTPTPTPTAILEPTPTPPAAAPGAVLF